MERDSSFLTHAVSAPDFTANKAPRPRLTRELQDSLERNLILVVAPAGYGKTTFLADFTARTEEPVCWVRLSAADQDPARLAGVVWESLCRRFRRLRSELSLSSEAGITPQALAQTMGRLLNERVPEPFVLIIDDFHLIHPSAEATRFLDSLLTELPPSSTMIVSSRELPRLSLAQWIANDQVKTFGPEELALTMDELNELVEKRAGTTLDADIAGELLAETEGWVTGVLLSDRLVSRALPTLAARDQPLAYDYLAQAAFHRESPEVQTFMVRSAVMPIMTADACDSVLQRRDSQAMLSQLLRKGLFVSATGSSPRIYEYHHLFRTFLLERFGRESPELAERLRLAAAEYFSESDWPEVAFELSMEAGAYDRAASVAEEHVDRFFELGRDRTVIEWAEAIWEAGEQAPRTFTRAARVHSLLAQKELTEVWLARARGALEASNNPDDWMHHLYAAFYVWDELALNEMLPRAIEDMQYFADPSDFTHKVILKLCSAYQALHVGGDIQGGLRMAEEGLELAPLADDQKFLAYAHITVGIGKSLAGEIRSGLEHFRKALAHGQDGDMLRRRPLALSNIGTSQLMIGEFSEAIKSVSEGLRLSREMNRPRDEVTCLVSLGDIYRCLGLADQSNRFYYSALELSSVADDRHWLHYCWSKIAANSRTQGRLDEAFQALERTNCEGGPKYYGRESDVQAIGILDYDDKIDVLAAVEKVTSSASTNTIAKAEAMVLGAERLREMGAFKESDDLVAEAVRYSEDHESEMVIASEAFSRPSFESVVSAIVTRDNHGGRALRYLDAIRRFNNRPSGKTADGSIQLTGLGSAEIQLDDRRGTDLRPLHLEVLYYLVDHSVVPRERLRDVFWGDLDPKQQGTNASTAIHAIRKLFGSEFIQTKGGAYRISPAYDLRYDVFVFERLLKNSSAPQITHAGKRNALEQAFRTYKGEFLPGYSSAWVLQRRRELEALYLRACHDLASLFLEDAAYGRASEVLKQARAVDRYDERLMAMRLTVLGKLGRLPQAVREYRLYVKRLADDLHLSPSSELGEHFTGIIEARGTSHWMLETGT